METVDTIEGYMTPRRLCATRSRTNDIRSKQLSDGVKVQPQTGRRPLESLYYRTPLHHVQSWSGIWVLSCQAVRG